MAICGLPVSFSLRRLTEHGSEAVPRRLYWEIQTPQAIRGDILLAAYEKLPPNAHPDFTDEGSWIEAAGYPITLTPGHPQNFKITYESGPAFGAALSEVSLIPLLQEAPPPPLRRAETVEADSLSRSPFCGLVYGRR